MSDHPSHRRVQLLLVVVALHFLFLLQYFTDLPNFQNDSNYFSAVANETTTDNTSQTTSKPLSSTRDLTSGIHIFHENIKSIHLIGERHSGTTYMTNYLRACFSEQTVSDFFVRKKHWFQPSPQQILDAVDDVDRDILEQVTNFQKFEWNHRSWWDIANASNPRSMFQTSLVLYMVRDVHQWMEAMRQRPWHWPNHLEMSSKNQSTIATMKYDPAKDGLKRHRHRRLIQTNGSSGLVGHIPKGEKSGDVLPGSMRIQRSFIQSDPLQWDEFIRAPLRLLEDDTLKSAKICQKGFLPGTISPCTQDHSYVPPSVKHIPRAYLRNLPFSVNDVVYELQPNGQPFVHPLALRGAKIKSLLDLPENWDIGGFAVIRYEDILNGNDNATSLNTLVEQVSQLLGVASKCPEHKLLAKKPHNLPEEFISWIRDHTDWDIEKRIGYARPR